MDKISNEVQHPERFPKSDHIELGSDGWLSPNGDYYKVGQTEHVESARYLLANSKDVQNLVRSRYENEFDRMDFDKKTPNPEKLKLLGFVLIRGPILRSDDALNFTPEQLDQITKAGIKVVSAYEGSKEFSSKELIEKLNEIKSRLQSSKIINRVRKSLTGEPGEGFRRKYIDEIENFIKDPLHKSINVDQFWNYFLGYQENGHEILPTEIFNILSHGFSEEMVVKIGRYIRKFRVVNLQGNEKLIIERDEYRHRGDSRDNSADILNYINMFVADPHTIARKFERLIYGGVSEDEKTPKIDLSNPDGYFADIVRKLMTS